MLTQCILFGSLHFFVFSVLEGITTQLVSIWFVIGSALTMQLGKQDFM